MEQVQTGDTVQVHYTGRLEDGTVFDSSEGHEPLDFTVGGGQVIQGFEEAVIGMMPGQSTTVTIPADSAYGAHRDDLIMSVPREQVPPGLNPEIGQELHLTLEDGHKVPVTVTNVSDKAVVLDANHPLAGQTLIFDIELVAVS